MTKAEKSAALIANKEPLNLEEAALYMGYKPSSVSEMVRLKTIPFYKPTQLHLIFKRSELDKFLFRNRTAPDYELEEMADQMLAGKGGIV